MNNIYKTLEFTNILQTIQMYCVSPEVKEKVLQLTPLTDLDELHTCQQFIDQAMQCYSQFGKLPLGYFENITKLLEKVNKDGVLFCEDFLSILQQLQNAREIIAFMKENEWEDTHLRIKMNELVEIRSLEKQIQRCIDPSGTVLDSASVELRRIRRSILSMQANIRTRISEIQVETKDMLSQETVSSRNNHLVLPVKSNYKNKVKGIVHSLSASGQTLFVEPAEVVHMNNQLVQLEDQERQEIHRILSELSKLVKVEYETLYYNQEVLFFLDEVFSKAMYGCSIDAVIPEVKDSYDSITLKQARHPLLDKNSVISNDIVIPLDKKILLISGSNTGGKTVVLKTVGLLSLMALSGLAVPCYQASIPFFDNIYVDLGDEQSIAQSLSTFSSHMKRLVHITNQVTHKSLVLLDEIGSGTDPQEGQSIAQAILEYMYQKQVLTIASTHYSGLKQFAKSKDYVIVAAVEFDQENMKPTYRLIPGNVGNSYAIEISKRLGLPSSIIEEAYQIKEKNLSESDRLLERLQDELTQLQIEKDKVDQVLKAAEQERIRYQTKKERLEKQRGQIKEEAEQQANQILEEAKTTVSKIMDELQAAQQIKPHIGTDAKRALDEAKHISQETFSPSTHIFTVGDRVKVASVNREGEVIAVSKKGILTIDMGGMKLNVKDTEVEYIGKKIKKKPVKTNLKSIKKATQQSYELNIVGKRYEEAMQLVDKFLDDALVQNYSTVRIIHGMGTGVLRKGVRSLLDRHPHVVRYSDGGPNEGGLGATLVYFE